MSDLATKGDVRKVRRESLFLYAVVVFMVAGMVGLAVSNRVLAERADSAAAKAAEASTEATAAAAKATLGVETACSLLVNFARQAGAGNAQTGASEASKLNRELTVLVVDQVIRLSPPDVRARITSLYHRLRKAGGIIRFPDCEQLARDPQSVKQLGPRKSQEGSTP